MEIWVWAILISSNLSLSIKSHFRFVLKIARGRFWLIGVLEYFSNLQHSCFPSIMSLAAMASTCAVGLVSFLVFSSFAASYTPPGLYNCPSIPLLTNPPWRWYSTSRERDRRVLPHSWRNRRHSENSRFLPISSRPQRGRRRRLRQPHRLLSLQLGDRLGDRGTSVGSHPRDSHQRGSRCLHTFEHRDWPGLYRDHRTLCGESWIVAFGAGTDRTCRTPWFTQWTIMGISRRTGFAGLSCNPLVVPLVTLSSGLST